MIEMPEAKILVRITSRQHTHAGVTYPHGSQLEVTSRTFEKMRRLGAAAAVEVAIAGSANIDMEVAREKVRQEQGRQQRTGGRSSPTFGRFGKQRR